MDARDVPDWDQAWGTDRELAQLYDSYLDAAYRSLSSPADRSGRRDLIGSIATELRARAARRVLDCSAGTGFPALDLAAEAPSGFEIHCSDASPEMLGVLVARATRERIEIDRLAPPRPALTGERTAVDALQLDWRELDRISASYDYVMCRGNSLAYTDSWGRDRRDVASAEVIRRDLHQMAARVRPGGHLHVDAPWLLYLPRVAYPPVATGALSIRERVTTESSRRRWQLDFELPTGQTLRFERFSTLLTIHDVAAILDELGLEETEPFQLPSERPRLGVIIARKP